MYTGEPASWRTVIHSHDLVVADQQHARARLDAAVRERSAADAELRAAIKAAHDAGVTQTELAELTGLHRHTIRAWLRDA